ncbi:MAG: tripartite tricarboxylate transporter TctB family protein [Pseudomonadota bacterium]
MRSAATTRTFASAGQGQGFASGSGGTSTTSRTAQEAFDARAPQTAQVAILDVHAFRRRQGDLLFSLLIAGIAAFFAWAFFGYTGWDDRRLPEPIGLYVLDQIGLAEFEGRARLGRILKQGWVAPAICLVILLPAALLNIIEAWRTYRWRVRFKQPSSAYHEVILWLRALEFVGWFIAYTALVPILGYLLSTLLLGTLLPLRLGYRSWRWLGICLLTSMAIVLLFRSGLQIRTPVNIWLYDQLPQDARNFMLRWF